MKKFPTTADYVPRNFAHYLEIENRNLRFWWKTTTSGHTGTKLVLPNKTVNILSWIIWPKLSSPYKT